ncbi:glutaredoxin 2 [Bisgaardia hudsonensis]|uniref:Glutaredoxin 2 n=1 Tax=Bisgaardia hudsonensis TaxID=109472 RepID=A0A4R2N1J5_9PAST|nr:glutaredoxin 2 [Bisgaardia hudsonensis]QLB13028.1 glutaredoxin, GrxB family [Bisgaardia hudsonensis]TCP13408.1 glutaredoxin 2 [Bisgaardia hudsonensis]
MKLYIYDHCPYCVRPRMIFGLKNIPVENITLLNDDEKTPIGLVGKKMVPILIKDDGSAMPESLDIVRYIDDNYGEKLLSEETRSEFDNWVKKVGNYYYYLLHPRVIKLGLKEYVTETAVDYFIKKKTASIGSFNEHLAKSDEYIKQLENDLAELEKLFVSESAFNGKLSFEDIILFPMLRNLTCVKGLIFPTKIKAYIERMSELTKIDLYTDRAI